jgi:hypothetical protein
MTKRVQPVLYITEEQYQKLCEKAQREDRTVTSLIKHLLLQQLREEK